MNDPIPCILALEGWLEEPVIRRLLEHSSNPFLPKGIIGRTGRGYIAKRLPMLNEAARQQPIIVLCDLESDPCPSEVIREWLSEPQQPNLVINLAVRQVESWILADRAGFARFLRISERDLPTEPDLENNPKLSAVRAAKNARPYQLRRDMTPHGNSTAHVGPKYTPRMIEFVRHYWDIERARDYSPSLNRAVKRLERFSPQFPEEVGHED